MSLSFTKEVVVSKRCSKTCLLFQIKLLFQMAVLFVNGFLFSIFLSLFHCKNWYFFTSVMVKYISKDKYMLILDCDITSYANKTPISFRLCISCYIYFDSWVGMTSYHCTTPKDADHTKKLQDMSFFAWRMVVESATKQFSLVALSYQPYLNPSIRSYVVYRLTTHQNQIYFNTYRLDRLLPTKQTNKKQP